MGMKEDALRRARVFTEGEGFDEETRCTAKAAMEDEQELLARFGSELAFGTGGLRGVLGVGTARMNRGGRGARDAGTGGLSSPKRRKERRHRV